LPLRSSVALGLLVRPAEDGSTDFTRDRLRALGDDPTHRIEFLQENIGRRG
jgi:hypothetical protein